MMSWMLLRKTRILEFAVPISIPVTFVTAKEAVPAAITSPARKSLPSTKAAPAVPLKLEPTI